MAAGTPVIASAVGSVPELVRSGETGLLIPPADEESLAGAREYILEDGARADRMRTQARQLVAARYSIDGTAARYRDLFDDVMAA
jgi:glycosyltransferase involved in cell wall biosynthesis